MKDAQIKGLILRFLVRVYPYSLTVDFINALLYDWRVFCSKEKLLKDHIRYLANKGYVELKTENGTEKVSITEKGLALWKGEILDGNVSVEV
jgi:hypothetical protein